EESVTAAAAALRILKKAYRALHELAAPVATDLTKTGYVQRLECELNEDMNTAAALAVMLEFAGEAARVAERAGGGETLYEYAYLLALLGIAPNETWLAEPAP